MPSDDVVCTSRHDYGNKQYVDAALKLRDMKGRGKIANIGVTNFDVTHLAKIVDAGVPIVSNQVRRPDLKISYSGSLMDNRGTSGTFLPSSHILP